MRTLVNRERNAIHAFLDELDTELATVRASTERATDGRSDMAHVELDFAHAALAEITDIAAVLTGYLDRLIPSTVNAQEARSGHGLIPPRRGVYTIDDDEDDAAVQVGASDKTGVAA